MWCYKTFFNSGIYYPNEQLSPSLAVSSPLEVLIWLMNYRFIACVVLKSLVIYVIKGLYFSFTLNNNIIFRTATINAGHISLKSLLVNEKIRKEIVNGNNTI